MNGRTNAQNGGSDYAVLVIKYEANQTVQILNNNIIVEEITSLNGLIDLNNSSNYIFYYRINKNNFGNWTVQGIKSEIIVVSKTISVSENKCYDIDLTYVPLYLTGTFTNDFSGGWSATNRRGASSYASGKKPTITINNTNFTYVLQNAGGTYQTNNSINLTPFSKLRVWWFFTTSKDGSMHVGVSTASTGYWDSVWAAQTYIDTKNQLNNTDVDISSLSGQHYVLIASSRGNSVKLTGVFYEIALIV